MYLAVPLPGPTGSGISSPALWRTVLARLRTPRWRRFGFWSRGLGIALLGTAAFAPLPAFAVAALGVPGLALFAIGALVWLARDAEPWRR